MRCPDAGREDETGMPARPGPKAAFYADLCTWREQLARSVARNNIGMRSGEIALAVHRVVFSFVILAIAEDRHLVPSGFLRSVFDANDRSGRLAEIFADAGDPWAGLEDAPAIAARHKSPAHKRPAIDDPVIEAIAARLLSADRPYDFSRFSLEDIVGVFDTYLSRTIRRSAAHQAVVADKPGAGPDGTAADPARGLVKYAVESTLSAAFAGRSPDEPLPLRILDPACGAGRSLSLAYRYLLDRPPGSRHTFEERTDLLRHSIHGLDLDPHAVAAARVLLAVVALEGDRAGMQKRNFFAAFGEVVRILSGTIRCGNALVDPEIADDESWAFCPVRERHALRPFDWHENFFEILAPGGFDAVIGCPPQNPAPVQEWMRQYLQRHFVVYDSDANLSAFFIEKGFSLLRARGVLGFVTGDRWLHAKSGAPLRSLLPERQIEEIVMGESTGNRTKDPGPCFIRVSNSPSAHPFVVRPVSAIRETADAGNEPAGPGCLPGFPVDPQTLSSMGWTFRDTRKERVLEKILRAGTPLGHYVLGEIRAGSLPGPEPAFVIDAGTREALTRKDPRCKSLVCPYIPGEDIGRYAMASPPHFCIFIPQGWTARHPAAAGHAWRWLKQKHPGLARQLKAHAGLAKDRPGQGDYWWETACDPDAYGEKNPLIFFPADRFPSVFVPGTGREIFGRDTCAIPSGSLYLLGILNSRLMAFVLPELREKCGPAPDDPGKNPVGQLPVYTPDFDDPGDAGRNDRMVRLVTDMLDLHRQLDRANSDPETRMIRQEIESVDKQIDSLVYGLYGLSVEEVAVVKSAIRENLRRSKKTTVKGL